LENINLFLLSDREVGTIKAQIKILTILVYEIEKKIYFWVILVFFFDIFGDCLDILGLITHQPRNVE